MRRRPISPFSLSFLDIMFCGFGAVVLLVLILNSDTVKARNARFDDLRSQVMRLENEAIVRRQGIEEMRRQLQGGERRSAQLRDEARQATAASQQLEAELAALRDSTRERRVRLADQQAALNDLEAQARSLADDAARAEQQGKQVHRVVGDGDRQYLTGLRLGGRRTLILLDASASMLDETIVNVLRLRNMDDTVQRVAPKWRRSVASAEWLLANLPADAAFQLYTFNTSAAALVSPESGDWLSASRRDDVEAVVSRLRQLVPAGGTSLHQAFSAAAEMQPRPDNILLITDGLPTQGKRKPATSTVSSDQRLDLFRAASKLLPAKVPVNVVLMPMEGDAYAAAAFWQMAVDTRGSLLTPARDWP